MRNERMTMIVTITEHKRYVRNTVNRKKQLNKNK